MVIKACSDPAIVGGVIVDTLFTDGSFYDSTMLLFIPIVVFILVPILVPILVTILVPMLVPMLVPIVVIGINTVNPLLSTPSLWQCQAEFE